MPTTAITAMSPEAALELVKPLANTYFDRHVLPSASDDAVFKKLLPLMMSTKKLSRSALDELEVIADMMLVAAQTVIEHNVGSASREGLIMRHSLADVLRALRRAAEAIVRFQAEPIDEASYAVRYPHLFDANLTRMIGSLRYDHVMMSTESTEAI